MPSCYSCSRPFREDESAWASDWKVIDETGETRTETRYICDGCGDA